MSAVLTRNQSAALVFAAGKRSSTSRHHHDVGEDHRHRVVLAVAAVSARRPADRVSYRKAAKMFDVCKATIQKGVARLKAGSPAEPAPVGARTALSRDEELFLVTCIV
jgi:hypothetical protein